MSELFSVPQLGTICMLCQEKPPINNSHLWPKFAVRWLKDNSSQYIRRADRPNVRMQDVTKFKLLCTSCESLFAVNEQKFAERVYKPFQSDRKMQQFEYGGWLSHFVISLIWRMVAVDYAALAVEFPNHAECAARAFEHWRLFLLKKHNI